MICQQAVLSIKLTFSDIREGFSTTELYYYSKHYCSLFQPNQFTGDTVNICFANRHKEALLNGVVGKTTEYSVRVTTNGDYRKEELDTENRLYAIVASPNDITYRRLTR